jgi:HD-GYP domain-containing protein (c-di-GMP phosphodiesterase class II)
MSVSNNQQQTSISRAELVSSLSHALDMTEGQSQGHGVRCAWIGLNIGRQAGLPDSELASLYYTLLLKDIGCSSNAARICPSNVISSQSMTVSRRS